MAPPTGASSYGGQERKRVAGPPELHPLASAATSPRRTEPRRLPVVNATPQTEQTSRPPLEPRLPTRRVANTVQEPMAEQLPSSGKNPTFEQIYNDYGFGPSTPQLPKTEKLEPAKPIAVTDTADNEEITLPGGIRGKVEDLAHDPAAVKTAVHTLFENYALDGDNNYAQTLRGRMAETIHLLSNPTSGLDYDIAVTRARTYLREASIAASEGEQAATVDHQMPQPVNTNRGGYKDVAPGSVFKPDPVNSVTPLPSGFLTELFGFQQFRVEYDHHGQPQPTTVWGLSGGGLASFLNSTPNSRDEAQQRVRNGFSNPHVYRDKKSRLRL